MRKLTDPIVLNLDLLIIQLNAKSLNTLFKRQTWARVVARWLRALALPEDPCSIPSTAMVAHKHL